jgi:peptidoglycan hydrolase-like protein with peptidoglycan-binding domain
MFGQSPDNQKEGLDVGVCGKEVRVLHKQLKHLGFKIPLLEGLTRRFSKGTAGVVKAFQQRHGLEPRGVVDEATMTMLQGESDRATRQYGHSLLPIIGSNLPPQTRQEILLALYTEVCSSWRMLTDVRFKLLGFVPTASIILLIGLLTRGAPNEGLSPPSRVLICIVGAVVTIGLYIYDQRNSELYNDLVSRGRRIEMELGIHTGQFLGRKKPANWLVNHSNAGGLIYGSAIIAWLCAIAVTWMNLI